MARQISAIQFDVTQFFSLLSSFRRCTILHEGLSFGTFADETSRLVLKSFSLGLRTFAKVRFARYIEEAWSIELTWKKPMRTSLQLVAEARISTVQVCTFYIPILEIWRGNDAPSLHLMWKHQVRTLNNHQFAMDRYC